MAKLNFSNLIHDRPDAGPTRIRVPTPPPERHLGWALLGVLVLIGMVGGGWWYWYRDKAVVSPHAQAQPQLQIQEVGVDVIANETPEPGRQVDRHHLDSEVAVADPLPVMASLAPVVGDDGAAVARKRRALADQVSSLERGVATIERTVAEHRRALVRPQAQVSDSLKRHWPKPHGSDTYEQHLAKLRAAAKARGDGHAVFTIDSQLEKFRDNQSKALFEIKRLQELIESGERRIAAAQAERAAAQAELEALP